MSLIAHLCTQCNHPDYWRQHHSDRCGTPGGCCRVCTPGPPQVRPTFDLYGLPVTRLIRPGDKIDADNLGSPQTCGCDDCKTLYQQQAQGAG